MPAKRNRRISLSCSLIGSLLCGAVAAMAFGALAASIAWGQAETEILHVPELDAGFHLLYQLKPAEARAQFQSWQKSHPEDPLGSASEAATYLFEEVPAGCLDFRVFPGRRAFSGRDPS